MGENIKKTLWRFDFGKNLILGPDMVQQITKEKNQDD